MAEPIDVVALIKINPDSIATLAPMVKELADKSRAEEGVARYQVYRILQKQGVYVFLQRYKNQAGREFHVNTPHFHTAMNALTTHLIEEPTVVSLQKLDI